MTAHLSPDSAGSHGGHPDATGTDHELADSASTDDTGTDTDDTNDTDGDAGRWRSRVDRSTARLLTLGGAVGLLASFQLTLDKIRVLSNPGYKPSCDLNPVLACSSVITTDQASVFGFPNPVLGLTGFAVVITLGILLWARVTVPRWVWLGLNAGALAAFAFIQWLVWQSLYSIGSLCPWCMVVWAVTIPMFFWVTAANLANGRLGLHGPVIDTLAGLRWVAAGGWFLVLGALIFVRWQDYWLGALGV